MKLLKMARTGEDGVDFDGEPFIKETQEYFVKLENAIDREEYDEVGPNMGYDNYLGGFWDGYMSGRLEKDIEDKDVYGYIMEDEPEPAVGGTYIDADGLVWERVK